MSGYLEEARQRRVKLDKVTIARFEGLNSLLADKVFSQDYGTLLISPGEEGFLASAHTRSGTPIEVPDIRGITPEIADMLGIIVGRGYEVEFSSPRLRVYLRKTDTDEVVASSSMQMWSAVETVWWFEFNSRA